MSHINQAYVYDIYKCDFWDNPYTAFDLHQMANRKSSELTYIRKHLYSQKENREEFRVVFANASTPHFKRFSLSEAKRKGINSVYETPLHCRCKKGIAEAEKLSIYLKKRKYILIKKDSIIEKCRVLFGDEYETDCEYTILNIDNELRSVLNGDTVYFEVLHTHKTTDEKSMAYRMNGLNIFEFNVKDMERFWPPCIKDETYDEEKAVSFIARFFEDTEKHFLKGTFYPPVNIDLEWQGGIAKTIDNDNKEIEIRIYRLGNTFERSYGIRFIRDGLHVDVKSMEGKRIGEFEGAQRYAAYLMMRHINNEMSIDFK